MLYSLDLRFNKYRRPKYKYVHRVKATFIDLEL